MFFIDYFLPPDSAFLKACDEGDAKRVRELLPRISNAGVEDLHGWSGLCLAASNGHLAAVEALLADSRHTNSSTVDKENKTPLMRAAEAGHLDIVKALFKRGKVNVETELTCVAKAYKIVANIVGRGIGAALASIATTSGFPLLAPAMAAIGNAVGSAVTNSIGL
jgi:ankyrin repeat protein